MNRIYFIKCCINSSLFTKFWLLHMVSAPWITVLSQHTVFTKRVISYKFTFVWYSTKQGTMHRHISHLTHLYTVPFLFLQEEHRRQSSGLILLASVCYGYFSWSFLVFLLLFFSSSSYFFYPSHSSPPHYSPSPPPPLHLIPSRCQPPEFHRWLPPQVLFIFFQPLLKTHNPLPCLDY